jgi:hypothetical protein
MQKDDVLGGIGAAGSTIIVFLGYLWNIGMIQLIFSFLAGSFSTYLIQHRLQTQAEKRKAEREHQILMRDKIYGPIYEAFNITFERLKAGPTIIDHMIGEYSPITEIKRAMDNYLFLLADEQTKEIVRKFYDDLLTYEKLLRKAEAAINEISKPIIHEIFQNAETNSRSIYLSLDDYDTQIITITLRDVDLEKVNLFDKFRREWNNLECPNYNIHIPKSGIDREDSETAEKLLLAILEKAEDENRLLEYWDHRQRCLSYLNDVLSELRLKVRC